MTFDGVRAEESTRRSGYDRIGKGKHIYTFNAHPILNWNNVEIFLYLMLHDLPINPAYKFGKSRVGCLICPFSTAWDDRIINKLYPNELAPFVEKIKSYASTAKIKDIDGFVKERRWKLKILGITSGLPQITVSESPELFRIEIKNPRQSFFSWLGALCDYTVNSQKNMFSGALYIGQTVYHYTIKENLKPASSILEINELTDTKTKLLIRRLAQKVAHCINCEVCEVDCPTGALSILPHVNIDKSKCIHCHKCLNVHDRGCVVADCNRMVRDSDSTLKIYGYKKFGLREEWLDDFMSDPEVFWDKKDWGAPMYEAFKRWAKDAEILDGKNKLTELGLVLKDIYADNPTLVWEVIWINLCYNSFIVNKFSEIIKFGESFTAKTLGDVILQRENVSSATTLAGACIALNDLLDKSPIGEDLQQGEVYEKSRVRHLYEDLSEEAIAYSLYRHAQIAERSEMRVSDFYSPDAVDGPYRQFGLPKHNFIKSLRYLASREGRILIAELNMGLDHITLDSNLSTIDVLKKLAL